MGTRGERGNGRFSPADSERGQEHSNMSSKQMIDEPSTFTTGDQIYQTCVIRYQISASGGGNGRYWKTPTGTLV